MPTQKRIRELFNYRDGKLIRKITIGSGVAGSEAGTSHNSGYRAAIVDGKRYMVHRLIWVYHNGEMKPDTFIDHINHVRHDNRLENLRCVTHRINLRNQLRRITNTSGFPGVAFHKKQKKWTARIRTIDREVWLGTFDTKRDAIIARKVAERLLSYHELYDIDGILIQDEKPSPRRSDTCRSLILKK